MAPPADDREAPALLEVRLLLLRVLQPREEPRVVEDREHGGHAHEEDALEVERAEAAQGREGRRLAVADADGDDRVGVAVVDVVVEEDVVP